MSTRQEKVADNLSQFWNVRDQFKGKSLEELQSVVANDRLPYAVCIINVTGELNVGMTIRSASLLGAEKVILYGSRKFDRRSAVGANHYIDLVKFDAKVSKFSDEIDYTKFHPMLADMQYQPIFIETNGISLTNITGKWKGDLKPCLVFGNEGTGIPTELLNNQLVYTIPQYGVLRSLNVSAAAAIAMYEFSKYV